MKAGKKHKELIKSEAYRLGFDYVGVSKAEFLEEDAPRLENYLQKNHHGKMNYMENHFDKRLDPRLLVDDAKSVVSFMINYFPEKTQNKNSPKIAKYAYGQDYHLVIRQKLNQLLEFINHEIGEVSGRGFVDSAPVLDKAWAKKSGLGWVGKNGNLINKKSGSFFFIAELIIDLELPSDGPVTDHCGTCTACIDECPTEAIVEPMVVDGSKCISYYTIELKESIPESVNGKFDNWMFGCDICQDICPWNRLSKPHNEPLFNPHPDLLSMTQKDWDHINQESFSKLFSKSAVKRTKLTGLKRNIAFLKKGK
ncbi:MAG: tRNA epoxyqueuosine(34) reductase QueG [Flavobacteriales bacterium]|nr:tRNA epoxyqueuosine(34) reductase QueG [Flavobacteriales bacterium]